MRHRPNPVEALLQLPRQDDEAVIIANFRQAMTALSLSVGVLGPPPLDGVDVDSLTQAVGVALKKGLLDDLDWIAPGSAAVALYELTSALPASQLRRELGRRVFDRLYQGTAATFAAVATRMALGSGKLLDAATMRARVSLVFDMPLGTAVNADPLALTLVTRRELHEKWVAQPATGALHARRLAAKLYEHAAREAVIRAQQGDPYALDLLCDASLQSTFQQLLADREPLVWRHAAAARGLLALVNSRVREEVELALDPSLSPTQWRRAAVSLVASLSGASEQTLRACQALMAGPIVRQDPGLLATMVLGLPRVVESEPDMAEQLLEQLVQSGRPDVAEACAILLSNTIHREFAPEAAATARNLLLARAKNPNSVLRGVAARALRFLEPTSEEQDSVHFHIAHALDAYENIGAREAFDLAVKAAKEAHGALDFIEAHDPLDDVGGAAVLGVLEDLDGSALEHSRLGDLLLLGRSPGDLDSRVRTVEKLFDRISRWVLDGEEQALVGQRPLTSGLANQRRLRALLHLVDHESSDKDSQAGGVRARILRTNRVLLQRLTAGPDRVVHRIICATLARSFDAAVREGLAEPTDLLLTTAYHLTEPQSIETIAEASTNPEMSLPLMSFARFIAAQRSPAETTGESEQPVAHASSVGRLRIAARVVEFSRGMIAGGSYRGEALRRVVLRLGRALEAVAQARGLSELVNISGSGPDALRELEAAADALRSLTLGANRRLFDDDSFDLSIVSDVAPLSMLVERAVRAETPLNPTEAAAALNDLKDELPPTFASCIAQVLKDIDELPVSAPSDVFAIPLEKRRAALPDWLLPRRTIGAFYVVQALGAGGVSSVFVARRIEERHDTQAESFALKVPNYDPTTARSLSEQEFFQLFREEAGALLSLPQHENLARFVTFDLAARPKPILVMELISGAALDRLIRSRSLTTERVFAYLDGILAGLEAMHSVGVGHLDLKPSNVILRAGQVPVLVDFGLSGRQLRPGCGTLEYCAPEVLGLIPKGHTPSPTKTDMYAFACAAFEMLTGELLFDAEDEMSLVSIQVSHDGWPEPLSRLARSPALAELCVVLAACLRRDPRQRPTATEARAALTKLSKLNQLPWPLSATPQTAGMSA